MALPGLPDIISDFELPRLGQVSQAEMELRPYLAREREKQRRKLALLRPVEALFDILSRGQYAAANLGQDIGRRISGEDVNLLTGVWEGISGKRKGDWRTTLFGGKDVGAEEYAGWFPNNPAWMEKKAKIPVIGATSAEDVIGFLANVFIDPTNYITFGASKAGKAAAREFAEQSVKRAMKDIGKLDGVAKVAKGFDREAFEQILERSPASATRYLQAFTKKSDLARYFNSVYRDAYREGLTLTSGSAVGRFARGATADYEKYITESARRLSAQGTAKAVKNLGPDAAMRSGGEIAALYESLLRGGIAPAGATKELSEAFEQLGKWREEIATLSSKEAVAPFRTFWHKPNPTDNLTISNLYPRLGAPRFAQKAADIKATREAFFGSKAGELSSLSPKTSIQNLGEAAGTADLLGAYETALRSGSMAEGASKRVQSVFSKAAEYANEVDYTKSPDFVKKFAGLGQHRWRIFGMETGLHSAGSLTKSYHAVVSALEKSGPGRLFTNAVWSLYNNPASPVAWIRKMFGFRNPYEKILRAKEQSLRYGFHFYADNEAVAVKEALDKIDDATLGATRDVINLAAEAGIEPAAVFGDPVLLAKAGIKDPEKVRAVVERVQALTRRWADEEHARAAEGLMAVFQDLDAYLPTVRQSVSPMAKGRTTPLGSFAPGFTREKTFTLGRTAEQEAAKIKWLLGLDDETALRLVKERNWSSFNMDLREMLTQRALAHAHAMTNADMVQQFREFGIQFAPQADPALNEALTRVGGDVSQLGLKQVSHPALQGYFFDESVADIVDRVVGITGSDDGLNRFARITNWFTQWWKGMATLSPGFLIRNDRTNRFLLFAKNGAKSLDPRQAWRAFVGSVYALHGEAGLKKAKIPMDAALRTLNETVGGKTVRELAERARRTGVISKRVMGFDMASSVEAYTKDVSLAKRLNPFSRENILFEKSHELNAIIESTPKLQSMLMDLEDMAKATDGTVTDAMIDFADAEAKKWFFDYDDLAPFEKNVMRKIIPFYSWIRKSIALNAANMVHYKEMYAIVPKFQRMIDEDKVSLESMPEYMREEAYIPTGEEDGQVRAFNPALPYADLNVIPFRFEMEEGGIPIPRWTPEEIKDQFLSMASPVFKTAGALFSEKGWDPFRKRELDSQAIAPRALRLIANKPGVLAFIDAAARFAGLPDGLNLSDDGKGHLLIDGKIQYLLENLFPLLNRLQQVADLPLTAFPELEEKLAQVTGYRDRYEGTQRVLKTLSFWAGLTQADIDLDKEDQWRFRDALKMAERARQKDKQGTPGAVARRVQYETAARRREARLRRE